MYKIRRQRSREITSVGRSLSAIIHHPIAGLCTYHPIACSACVLASRVHPKSCHSVFSFGSSRPEALLGSLSSACGVSAWSRPRSQFGVARWIRICRRADPKGGSDWPVVAWSVVRGP